LLAITAASADAQTGNVTPHVADVLSLHDVLDSALARHPLAEASRARVRAARGARTSARAFGNPVLSYDVENAPFPGGNLRSAMDRETMTTATLPLESIVQRSPRTRRADADVRVAEADGRGARQQLALDASRAFFQTALAQVRIEIARDLTTWLDSVVAYNRTRVEEGVAAEADLIRAELERDRADAQLTLHEAEHARMRTELAAFIGDLGSGAPHIVVAVDDKPMRLPPFADSSADHADSMYVVPRSVVGIGLERRPDVRAARERLAAAGAGVSVERFAIVRALGATLGTKRSAGTTSMVAGFSMPLPIFDPNRGEIARASAERDVAAFELAARERTARAELAGAYEAARLLTERASLLVRTSDGRPSFLARADEARRIALGAYREGAVPLLQVIDAARAWGEARLTFYEMLYAQHESVALLLAARGDDVFTELPALGAGQTPSR
ncbi:MAG TPA: TolC family protein, partial [Gemmatimonadaceae bacterium]|nr:TolC family protein [Gemmatimonadaceae bacterium]